MKTPDWLRLAVAENAARTLGGEQGRAEADAAVTAAILSRPEYVAEWAGALAAQQVGAWLKEHESSGDLFQAALFPLLPASMQSVPGTPKASVMTMNGRDLDNARAVLWNRTGCSIAGAEADRVNFSTFYDKVRPLLAGDRTVADAVAELAAKDAA